MSWVGPVCINTGPTLSLPLHSVYCRQQLSSPQQQQQSAMFDQSIQIKEQTQFPFHRANLKCHPKQPRCNYTCTRCICTISLPFCYTLCTNIGTASVSNVCSAATVRQQSALPNSFILPSEHKGFYNGFIFWVIIEGEYYSHKRRTHTHSHTRT